MKLKYYLLISIIVNVVLLYIIFKPSKESSQLDSILLDRIKKELIIHKNKVIVDSIRHEAEIEKLNKKVYYVQKQRKNEHNKYELELSKINHLVNDSSITFYLDSIEKVCCTGINR